MSETPPETVDPAEALNEALVAFTACVGEALDGICTYGLTIGETYVPFDPDPDEVLSAECEPDDDGFICSQLWVRVMDSKILHVEENSFSHGECGGVMSLSLEVGVLRCLDIPEDGKAPTATDMLVASMQAMTDMKAIHCAAMDCEVWDSINSLTWVPSGPLGGQYGGIWTFEVEV